MNHNFEYEPYLKQVEGLFPLPGIMAQLTMKLRSYDSTVDEIAELLLSDATLVASIIRMSNSSYFNFSEKSETLSDAINRIGLREILCIVGLSVVDQVYQKELDRYRVPPEVFWESGIAAGSLMEAFAEAAGEETDCAYLAGLMREIGMLVINLMLNEEKRKDVWDSYLPIKDWEKEVCGYDHTEIGAQLLELWQFPEVVNDAVRGQWGNTSEGSFHLKALNLCNHILARCGCDFSVPIEDWSQFDSLSAPLGLSADELCDCVGLAVSKFERLKSSVG